MPKSKLNMQHYESQDTQKEQDLIMQWSGEFPIFTTYQDFILYKKGSKLAIKLTNLSYVYFILRQNPKDTNMVVLQ